MPPGIGGVGCLIRRLGGTMFDRPRDLAAMEATCRSWRTSLIEGNDVLDVGDGDKAAEEEGDDEVTFPCPWKVLTLKRFPRIKTILKRRSKLSASKEVEMTWKSLYREQRYFEKDESRAEFYKPKTTMDDYSVSVEFFRKYKRRKYKGRKRRVLFSIEDGDVLPDLFEDEEEEKEEEEEEVGDPAVSTRRRFEKEDVDPEVYARCWFGEKGTAGLTAKVFVTHLADMKTVTLGFRVIERCYLRPLHAIDHDDKVCLSWEPEGEDSKPTNLPCLRNTLMNASCDAEHDSKNNIVLDIFESGRVKVIFYSDTYHRRNENIDNDQVEWDDNDLLTYLEVECPWPNKRGDEVGEEEDSSSLEEGEEEIDN